MLLDAVLAVTLTAGPDPVGLKTVVSGLSQPTSVISAPNGNLFVTQKGGRIVKVTPSGKQRTWFRIKVSKSGERGLLSMARIDTKGFYAAYTDPKGALKVSRFRKGGAEHRILRIPHARYDNHNGGQLVLYKGLLYISTGDGGGAGDPYRSAGNPRDLRGKILRVDPTCRKKRYCIPKSNPKSPRRAVIASGLRNPWRFSIDPVTEQLWIGDVGQNAFEEVDRMGVNGRLKDFGWSCWEARSKYNADACPGRRMTKPVLRYAHDQGESIIGGHVYRGTGIPSLRGWYVFGDFISGRIWAYRDGRRKQIGTADGVTSFGLAASGEMLLTTIDGRVLKITG
ncbi:MAG: PQQ-dependent sugar dehydrogenase [Candidatus Nanopelagicales bacterium]